MSDILKRLMRHAEKEGRTISIPQYELAEAVHEIGRLRAAVEAERARLAAINAITEAWHPATGQADIARIQEISRALSNKGEST